MNEPPPGDVPHSQFAGHIRPLELPPPLDPLELRPLLRETGCGDGVGEGVGAGVGDGVGSVATTPTTGSGSDAGATELNTPYPSTPPMNSAPITSRASAARDLMRRSR